MKLPGFSRKSKKLRIRHRLWADACDILPCPADHNLIVKRHNTQTQHNTKHDSLLTRMTVSKEENAIEVDEIQIQDEKKKSDTEFKVCYIMSQNLTSSGRRHIYTLLSSKKTISALCSSSYHNFASHLRYDLFAFFANSTNSSNNSI